ncbi:MAG: antibiotic biosynthesis monooxygenase family protein [Gaiellaceae bacterium]
MFSRVTLVEIDTVRIGLDEAVQRFEEQVLPGLRDQDGYEGVVVLVSLEGRGMIISFWESEEAAAATAAFAAGELARFMLFFKAPPGREHYEVALAELPAATMG